MQQAYNVMLLLLLFASVVQSSWVGFYSRSWGGAGGGSGGGRGRGGSSEKLGWEDRKWATSRGEDHR